MAEIGAPNRWIVSTGMITFGLACLVIAPGWPRAPGIAMIVAGISSLGVAAFPCTQGCPGVGSGELTDIGHTVMAGLHYAALLAAPILLGPRRLGLVVSVIAGAALAMHVFGPGPNGSMQRIGLTTLDMWLIWISRRSLPTQVPRAPDLQVRAHPR